MKSFLHFNILVAIFCIILFTQLTSCVVIRVTDADTGSGKLTLKDKKGKPADTLITTSGKIIKWKIETHIVKSFHSIPPKPSAENSSVFKKEPHKKFLSKTFKGKLEKTETVRKEVYSILWEDQKHNPLHTYDPLIQVNPK